MKLFRRTASATPGQRVDRVAAAIPARPVDPARLPIASPWSTSENLQRIVFEDIFGRDIPVNTRDAAMKIPAVARARNLLVSTIARFPLVEKHGAEVVEGPSPAWMYRAGNSSWQQRTTWTVDDLIFFGWSCWWRTNDPETGYPLDAVRLEQAAWEIDPDGRGVLVNGQPVADTDVILIPGLHEGILTFGSEVLADGRALMRKVRDRIANPVPAVDLHQTSGQPLPREQRAELIAGWNAARRGEGGGVAYTSPNIEAKPFGDSNADELMVEERNALAVDIARLIGLPAGLLDATTPKASLNYETTTGRNQEFVDFALPLYTTAIVARLSLDDVTRPGAHVAFDLGDFTGPTPAPHGPALED